MPVFSGANLIGGLLFGSIGFVAFIYGKRMHVWKPMLLGLALMAYPYFVENDIALFAARTSSRRGDRAPRLQHLLRERPTVKPKTWVANGCTPNEKLPG
jgi:hypothetical protein